MFVRIIYLKCLLLYMSVMSSVQTVIKLLASLTVHLSLCLCLFIFLCLHVSICKSVNQFLSISEAGETVQQNILILWQKDLETLKITATKPSFVVTGGRDSLFFYRDQMQVSFFTSCHVFSQQKRKDLCWTVPFKALFIRIDLQLLFACV